MIVRVYPKKKPEIVTGMLPELPGPNRVPPSPRVSLDQMNPPRQMTIPLRDQRLKTDVQDGPAGDKTVEMASPDVFSILARYRAGLKTGTAVEYIPLPWQRYIGSLRPGATCWRIELHGLEGATGPLGLDILDDVVLGRGGQADVDLEPYGGFDRAVSRRHAILRPTRNQLHLIDLGSTNGTFFNGIPLSTYATYSLKHDESVCLGLLSFTIKIIDGPFALG